MSDFLVNFGTIEQPSRNLNSSAQTLADCSRRLAAESNRLSSQTGLAIDQLQNHLISRIETLRDLAEDVNVLAHFVRFVHSTAVDVENAAYRELGGTNFHNSPQTLPPLNFNAPSSGGGIIGRFGRGLLNIIPPIIGGVVKSAVGAARSVMLKTGTAVSGAATSSNINSSAGVNLLHTNVGTSTSSTSARAWAEASLVNLHASAGGDWWNASVQGNVGHVYANASASAGFMQNTLTWDPKKGEWVESFNWINLSASAAAGVSLLSGSASAAIGSGLWGADVNASGSLVGARASASATISVCEIRGLNAYVQGSAMAYVANGRVQGGINLGFIRIGGHVSGYVGAGASGRVGIYNNAFYIGGSLAAGLGVGAGISIGFNPDFIPNLVQGAQNVGNAVVSGAQVVGNAVVSGAQTVGNAVVSGAQTVWRAVTSW